MNGIGLVASAAGSDPLSGLGVLQSWTECWANEDCLLLFELSRLYLSATTLPKCYLHSCFYSHSMILPLHWLGAVAWDTSIRLVTQVTFESNFSGLFRTGHIHMPAASQAGNQSRRSYYSLLCPGLLRSLFVPKIITSHKNTSSTKHITTKTKTSNTDAMSATLSYLHAKGLLSEVEKDRIVCTYLNSTEPNAVSSKILS